MIIDNNTWKWYGVWLYELKVDLWGMEVINIETMVRLITILFAYIDIDLEYELFLR